MEGKLKGKRIFITEDNTNNRVVYTMVLRLSGAVLEFDRWGHSTLTLLEAFEPHLIILDLMLSRNIDGFTIFEEIRRDPKFQAVPIVAISASEPAVAIPKCIELGFSGFIAKPVNDRLLPDQLARLINGEQFWYADNHYEME
ncbi:MAG: response regulator [Anaerolineae bacterium]|jgi:CheY-like chemotaxis protein|nr:response regulator [Anaerolineae bacterium]